MAAQYLATVMGLLSQYYPELITQPNAPLDSAGCAACRSQTYDFIIVGAGSAGSVLANRLSENPNWKILLIEAGGDENFLTNIPSLYSYTFGSAVDWNYTTVPQRFACTITTGRCMYPRGYVLGGSSSINVMIYYRASNFDYDEWALLGNAGWGSKDVLRYFLKLENMTIPEFAADTRYHSTRGPQDASYSLYRPKIIDDLLQANAQYGVNIVDYNGEQGNLGGNFAQKSVSGPIRASASKSYLEPIRLRKNLYIFKNTEVTKVLFNDETPRRAVGVSCVTNGEEYNVYANGEVILSAGAINTPKLLMLSGVGPREQLRPLGIPVQADLPVGKYLQDHPLLIISFLLNNNSLSENLNAGLTEDAAVMYAKTRQGPLTTDGFDVFSILNRANSTLAPPDVILYAGNGNFSLAGPSDQPKLLLFLGLVAVKSVGSVKLADGDYKSAPLIDPNFYAHRTDLRTMLWGMRQVFKIVQQPALARYAPVWDTSLAPPCQKYLYLSDSQLICYIKFISQTFYHPTSTARMGPMSDRTTVVDSTLKVHRVRNLRVVDASVMPRLPHGNTNIPTIMLAEKAADLIKGDYLE